MVTSIYSNKKGIYKDLYRQIDSDKNKKTKEESHIRQRKGIYVELYNHIENKYKDKCVFKELDEKQRNSLFARFTQMVLKIIDVAFSKASYCISSAGTEVKMLFLACLVAKKPVNSYIDNNLQPYLDKGTYYNGKRTS